jgi:hypothetical protein
MGALSWLPGRLRETSRLLLASGLLMAVALVWFLVNLAHPVGPEALLWAPIPIGAVVLTLIYLRTSRTASLPAPVQRFWRHLTLVAALVGVASAAQAVDVVSHPDVPGRHVGTLMQICDGGTPSTASRWPGRPSVNWSGSCSTRAR